MSRTLRRVWNWVPWKARHPTDANPSTPRFVDAPDGRWPHTTDTRAMKRLKRERLRSARHANRIALRKGRDPEPNPLKEWLD